MTTLLLIPGDQLSPRLSALKAANKSDTIVLMAEVWDRASYVHSHKKKITYIFASMRHYADELQRNGWRFDYIKLNAPENTGSLTGELGRAIQRRVPHRLSMAEAVGMTHEWHAQFGLLANRRQ